jgi:hypothetical protein
VPVWAQNLFYDFILYCLVSSEMENPTACIDFTYFVLWTFSSVIAIHAWLAYEWYKYLYALTFLYTCNYLQNKITPTTYPFYSLVFFLQYENFVSGLGIEELHKLKGW